MKEKQFEIDPSKSNRAELSRAETKLRKICKLEENYWKQKAGISWFVQVDNNTRLFHSYVQGIRKKTLYLRDSE